MVNQRIDTPIGDTFSFTVQIDPADEYELISLSFKVKANRDAVSALIDKSVGHGISVVSEGLYAVELDPADTASLAEGTYYYVLKTGLDDKVYTLIYGDFNLIKA
ncbi:MAG: hypothetical protein K5663_08520 [Clostridiales bacterium]|nr:hypothetical protein [Clostridiales bacterium]